MRNLILKGIILRQPTIDELKKGSDYLEFHVRMYVETYNELISEEEVKGWNTKHNCFLESHLLHARALIEFFLLPSDSKNYPTDLRAADYIEDWNVNNLKIDLKFLKSWKKSIGGIQLHLTSTDSSFLISQREWPISEIFNNLHPMIVKFMNLVPKEKVDLTSQKETIQILDNIIFFDDKYKENFST